MSVSLSPSSQLSFTRPLTQLVKRTLAISNHNDQPVAFKVKTTAPKVYVVRPNSGRVDPGGTVEVLVMILPMKEDPPLSVKCKDKFLVQSTIITPEKEHLALADIWSGSAGDEIVQQKLKVAWLPAEGQPGADEPEEPEYPSMMTQDDSKYDTVRHIADTNGFSEPDLSGAVPRVQDTQPLLDLRASPPLRTMTPAANYHETHDEAAMESSPARGVHVSARTPSPAVPSGLEDKLAEAEAEIQRLRALLASMPEPASVLRHRRGKSDGGGADDAANASQSYGEQELMTDGYSPQSVAMIAFAVFLFTYLFF